MVLGSFEGQVEGEAWSGVASLPTGGAVDTSLAVHIDLVRVTESYHQQSQCEADKDDDTH